MSWTFLESLNLPFCMDPEADSSFAYQAQLNREIILPPKRSLGDFLLLY